MANETTHQAERTDAPTAATRVGVDIGGTFTDVFMLDQATGELRTAKTWSNADDPASLLGVFDEIGVDCSGFSAFSHAATVGVNAVVTRTGAATGLLCTRGHRDVLDMGRGLRRVDQLWNFSDLRPHLARPIIRRSWRRPITERTIHDGSVLVEIDPDEVTREVEWLVERGAQSIAIAYINSYLNPGNERRTRDIVTAAFPGLPVFTSTDIFPVFREVYRTTSVAINAYVSPKVDGYISDLQERLGDRGFRGDFTVMKVDGGFATGEGVRGRGVETVHSGPVAGVSAARYLGQEIGQENLMILDMGGTTTDVSILSNGLAEVISDFEVEQDLFLGIPVVDVASIGTGGGSIAWVDAAGGLRVGPASAGSEPGPACYGRGGIEPTVTDAHLVRGTLSPAHFLGGRSTPDVTLARTAIERVSWPLGVSVEEAAQGIIDIAEINMAGALRSISIFRGKDPRDFALMPVGAAGPMHGAALGAELGVAETIIPPWPGEFSAFGLLASDYRASTARSLMALLHEVSPERLTAIFAELERDALAQLHAQGVDPTLVTVTRWMDGAYAGQSWDTACALPRLSTYEAEDVADAVKAFDAAYAAAWGAPLGMPVRVSALRVEAIGAGDKPVLRRLAEGSAAPSDDAVVGTVEATLRQRGALTRAPIPIYERAALLAGNEFAGPAIVVQETSTTVLHEHDHVRVDEIGNLRIVRKEG